MKKNFKITVILSTIVCATFGAGLQSSNSNKALILKDNIEAISESANGNDPGGAIHAYSCYSSIKSSNDSSVNKCQDGTTLFAATTTPDEIMGCSMTIYGCVKYSNHRPALLSRWGLCY